MAQDDNPKNIVQSVAKVFAVLRTFDAALPELTISEVAARADLKMLARPLLAELAPDLVDAASLGMLDDTDVVYVERVQKDMKINLDRRTGSRTGAYGAALGHAILAFLPVEKAEDILRRSNRVRLSERTLTDLDELMNRLALVRKRGYAVSDGENAYGLRTIAAPVLGSDGEPVAGVSATITVDRMSLDDFVSIVAPRVQAIAAELSSAVRLTFGSVAQARM